MMRSVRCAAAAVLGLALAPLAAQAPQRPNVLWIFVEDMNAWLGCYGHDLVPTPRIDELAGRGVRFERAYMPAGVCSATRSAVITGVMQTTTGTHNHRSARAEFRGQTMGPQYDAIRLPEGVRTAPELFRSAGYYTFNQGKTDYNFVHHDEDLYDRSHGNMNFGRLDLSALWAGAKAAGVPFFGQIQLRGGKNRPAKVVDRDRVDVPPYYPDIHLVREEIAHHYDCVAQTDAEVGAILDALRRDGLLDQTVVLFFSDHGYRMHRHKQFLYEGGIRVPLIAAGPGMAAGTVRKDLVSGIDIAATSLALAGIERPTAIEGRDVFADDYAARPYVVAARDRCDYTIEHIRAVVTPRFKYLRNFMTDRPYMQPQYRDPWPVTKKLRQMAARGELSDTQLQFYGEHRPAEELYDLRDDPHEIHNLAADPDHRETVEQHREILARWIAATGDRGHEPESEAGLRAALRRWGDKCVNPEYDSVREKLARENEAKYRVLILGDSISMGYTPFVTDMLFDDAVVIRPKENCAGTSKGVSRIDDWVALDGGRWDVITFNFGLHDLKRVKPDGKNSNDPSDSRQAEPDAYERQLREIVGVLQATGASLIFVTTTPVPSGGVRPHRAIEDVPLYNDIARRVMADHDIEVLDLYGYAATRIEEIQQPVNVHFSRQGSRQLAQQVAERVRAARANR